MRPTDNIEKLLLETPVPSIQDGLHRVSLLQQLLTQMQTEQEPMTEPKPMTEETLPKFGDLLVAHQAKPWHRTMRRQRVAIAAVAALLVIVGAVFAIKWTSDRAEVALQESQQLAAPVSPGTEEGTPVEPLHLNMESLKADRGKRESPPVSQHIIEDVTGQPPQTDPVALKRDHGKRESLRERSLEQCVGDAEVIVVATALNSAPVPPKSPGDVPEVAIRFKVTRVLKGKLDQQIITTQTPTAAVEFIGKEWVIMLSPEFIAGKHSYAECRWIKDEPEVAAILSKAKK